MKSKIGNHIATYTLRRLALSPYHKSNFREKEISMLNELSITDSSLDQPHHFYITNTLVNFSSYDIDFFNEKTKLIIHPNSGYDNFPIDFVKKANFPIIVGNKIRAKAVAEYTLACLFSHITQLQNQKDWLPGRKWDRDLLENKHIVIFGYGNIGKILKSSLLPLTANISVIDPFKSEGSESLKSGNYDIVLMACSLNRTSRGIIDEKFLTHCSDDLLIINGARGKLINQEQLITFLKGHKNSFAYLDVFENEPADFKQFEALNNVQLSSHIAGVSLSLDQAMIDYEKKVLSDFLTMAEQDFREVYKDEILQNRLHTDQDGLFLI